jgi:hypothetical protein
MDLTSISWSIMVPNTNTISGTLENLRFEYIKIYLMLISTSFIIIIDQIPLLSIQTILKVDLLNKLIC